MVVPSSSEALGFVNNVACLLRNNRPLNIVDDTLSGYDFFIDPTFRTIVPPQPIQTLLDTVFGTNPEKCFFNVRMHTILQTMANTGLVQAKLDRWPRLTYDLNTLSYFTIPFGTNVIAMNVDPSEDVQITVIGDMVPDYVQGRLMQSWLIRTLQTGGLWGGYYPYPWGGGKTVEVTNILDGTVRSFAGTDKLIPLHSSSFDGMVLQASFNTPNPLIPTGTYKITSLARPDEDLADLETRIKAVGQDILAYLFRSSPEVALGEQLFNNSLSVSTRIAGFALALTFKLEELRVAGNLAHKTTIQVQPRKQMYVAVHDPSVTPLIPTDWNICNGNNGRPDFQGKYVRGGSGSGGSKTHDHSVALFSVAADGGHEHQTGTDTSPPISAGVPLCSPPLLVALSDHEHDTPSVPDHTHNSGSTTLDPATLLPPTKVVNWICKLMTDEELNIFPTGTILGLPAGYAVPPGWELCDGFGGRPNLESKFPKVFLTPSNGGSAENSHDGTFGFTSVTPTTGHSHSQTVVLSTSTTVRVKWAGLLVSDANHGHPTTTSTDGVHTHAGSFTVSGDADNLPPYEALSYIIKTGGAVFGIAPAGLTVLFDPTGTVPGGWAAAAAMDGVFLAGQKSGDSDFSAYGNRTPEPEGKWGTSHKHDVLIELAEGGGASTGGDHTHGSSGSPQDTGAPSSIVAVRGVDIYAAAFDHVHSMYTEAAGGHNHMASGETPSSGHEPEYTGVKAITRT